LCAAIAVVAVLGTLGVLALTNDDERTVVVSTTGATEASAPVASDPIDEDDIALTAREVDGASAAAIELAGGGNVSEVSRSDDVGEAYEVEVLTDTGEVDIALDENFKRVPNLRYDD
jgi:hypothetical protein